MEFVKTNFRFEQSKSKLDFILIILDLMDCLNEFNF